MVGQSPCLKVTMVIDGIVDSVLASPAAKDVIISNVLQFLMDFKAARVKSHQYHPKLPAAGSHMASPDNNGGAASGFIGVNNGSESEPDFVRKLQSVNPEVFAQDILKSSVESPECIITDSLEACTFNTGKLCTPQFKMWYRSEQQNSCKHQP